MSHHYIKVSSYQYYELQQNLLNAIGPLLVKNQTDWQKAFYSRLIHQPVRRFLESEDADKSLSPEEEVKRVIAFLRNKNQALSFCENLMSDNNIERLTNHSLKFLKGIWETTPSYTKEKAAAAIKALIFLEIAYTYLEKINTSEALKAEFEDTFKTLIDNKYQSFEKAYLKEDWLDSFSKMPNVKIVLDEFKFAYAQSYFKKDLAVIKATPALWQWPLSYFTFVKNLSWLSLRSFRFAALALPTLIYHLFCRPFVFFSYMMHFVLYHSLSICDSLLEKASFFPPARFLKNKFFSIRKAIHAGFSACTITALTLGWLWFCFLSTFQAIGFFSKSATLAMKGYGLTGMMLTLTHTVGPLLWIGLPVGLCLATSIFIGVGFLGSIALPLKRIFFKEKLSPLNELEEEVLIANQQYFTEYANNNYNSPLVLDEPVYIEDKYQICLSNEELFLIKQKAVLPRFNVIPNAKEAAEYLFEVLKKNQEEDPEFAKETVSLYAKPDDCGSYFPLTFSYQRNDTFAKFKQSIAENFANDYVDIAEKSVPRL